MLRLVVAAALLLALPATAGASHAEKERSRHRARAHDDGRERSLPPVEMEHLSTRETFVLRPDGAGHLGGKRLRGFKHFLRCHHTGREHAMAPHLAQLLYATAHHFGDRPILVIAGYRAPKVAREKGNPRSPHKRGVACDFRIEGVATTAIRDWVRGAFHGVGVGYYPNSNFVHLDVGRSHDAFWIDYSGPGERARYSSDPEGDLRSGIVDGVEPDGDGEGEGEGEGQEWAGAEDAAPSSDPAFLEDPGLTGNAARGPSAFASSLRTPIE